MKHDLKEIVGFIISLFVGAIAITAIFNMLDLENVSFEKIEKGNARLILKERYR